MDPLSASLITFGVIILLCSWVYLLILSFQDDYSWGLTTLFLPPLSYVYCLFSLEKSGSALLLAIIGWILVFAGL